MLPDSRSQTCNTATPIYPGTVNDLQDWQVRSWKAMAGGDPWFADDFLGALGSCWSATALGVNSDTCDDAAADGFGALRLRPDAGNLDFLRSFNLPMTARRFRLGFRMRWHVAPTHANSHAWVGLADWATQDLMAVGVSVGQTSWHVVQRLGTAGTNTGVAANAQYHTFQFSSDGTTVTLSIDGAVAWTGAHPANWNPRLEVLVARDAADVAIDFRLDRYALWVAA